MRGRVSWLWLIALPFGAVGAQRTPRPRVSPPAAAAPVQDSAARREAREAEAARALVAAEARAANAALRRWRSAYLARSRWQSLGDRCQAGVLRAFPGDTTPELRDSLQALVERMESTVLLYGVGVPVDSPSTRALLQLVVRWEAGIDRPVWDAEGSGPPRRAMAAGLTGEVADPRGPGCLPSPVASDTVTFVVPGVADLPLPQAPRPRVRAFFGPQAPQAVRDDFFTRVGRTNPAVALTYIRLAPVVRWGDWAVVGVQRPVEPGGVALDTASHGGAVYLMRRVGAEWRLLAIVRSWGG